MNEEFIIFLQNHFYIPLYLLTWIVAVIRYRRYYDTVLKYFPIFIIYTFFTELLGYFIKYHEFQFIFVAKYSWYNIIIYNIYQVITFLFFYWIYYKTVQSKTYKKWIKYGVITSILSYVISLFFQNPFYTSLYYADIVGALVLLTSIFFYFKEKKMELNPYPIKYNLLYWVSIGTFIFYLFAPNIWLMSSINYGVWVSYKLYYILLALIVLMYSLFIIGLLIGKRKAFR